MTGALVRMPVLGEQGWACDACHGPAIGNMVDERGETLFTKGMTKTTSTAIKYHRRPCIARGPQTPTHDYYGEVEGQTVVRIWVDRAGRTSGTTTRWWAKDNEGHRVGETRPTLAMLKQDIASHFDGSDCWRITRDGYRIQPISGGRYIVTPPTGWRDAYGTPVPRRSYEFTDIEAVDLWIEQVRAWQQQETRV